MGIEAVLLTASPIVARDGLGFIEYARQLSMEPLRAVRTHDQHPGYPALVWGAERALAWCGAAEDTETWTAAARLTSAVAGVVCVALLWWLARELHGVEVANAAALVAAVLPVLRQNAADALSDMPHLACYLGATAVGLWGLRHARLSALASAGALSGAAYWIRPEGLSVAAVLMVWLAMARMAETACNWHWRSRAVLVVGLGAALVAAPNMLLTARVTGKLANKALWASTATPTGPLAAEVASAATPRRVAAGPDYAHERRESERREFLDRSRLKLAAGAVTELATEWTKALQYVLIWPLAVGWARLRRASPRGVGAGLVTALMAWQGALLLALYFVGGYISHRHVMPIVVLCLPAVAVGGGDVARRIQTTAWGARYPRWAAAAVAAGLLALCLPRGLRPINAAFRPLHEAGIYVRTHAAPGDRVLTNVPHALFYSGQPGLVLVKDGVYDVATALDLARDKPYAFVVLDVGDPLHFDQSWLAPLQVDYERVHDSNTAAVKTHHHVAVFRRRGLAQVATRPEAPPPR